MARQRASMVLTARARRRAFGFAKAISIGLSAERLRTHALELPKASQSDWSICSSTTENPQGDGFFRIFSYVDPSLASLSIGVLSTFAAGGGSASGKGSDPDASNEYVNLDRRQSSSAIGRGSMPTPAHHEASSP
jgi:hypothetical protein